LGCSNSVVHAKRKKLGIVAWRPMSPHRPWTADEIKLLGTLPDEEVTRRLKRTFNAVVNQRYRRGIRNPSPQVAPGRVWKSSEIRLFGRRPDSEVARKLRCSSDTISRHRKRLGIPAWRQLAEQKYWTATEERLLGKMADHELAKRLGCRPMRAR